MPSPDETHWNVTYTTTSGTKTHMMLEYDDTDGGISRKSMRFLTNFIREREETAHDWRTCGEFYLIYKEARNAQAARAPTATEVKSSSAS